MLWEAPLLVGRSTRTEGELQEAQRSTKQPVFGRQDRESHTQMVPATALDAPAWDSTTGASGAGCWNTCLGDRWHHREHASRVWERTAVSCVETAWKGWGWSIARLQLGMFPEAQAGHAERSHVLSHCGGFSCCWAQALGHAGFSSCGSWALEHRLNSLAHGLSCSTIRGIFLDQGLNPCLLHWEVDSLPLIHQGNLNNYLKHKWIKFSNQKTEWLNG